MSKPRNIIFIVADSLRYDSVYRNGGPGVPYLEQNAIQFTNARSSGCWTLPATSSLFTGLLPHEHGATTQSRWLDSKVPRLADKLRKADYKILQVTANPVTTDIFNVNDGFDETHTAWSFTESKHPWFLQLVLSLNRPRIRRMLFKPSDIIMDKLSEDLRQGITWAQKTANDSLAKARQLIEARNAKGENVFMFINLMETHYPYHIAETFSFLSKGVLGKIHESKVLYHFLGQTFLKSDKPVLQQSDLDLLRTKQQLAWHLIKDDVNTFCRDMHENTGNLVVFCSDHGDNFGDQGWQYHFSNVTDGGNRVPLFWLDHDGAGAGTKAHNISSRFIHYDILRAAGVAEGSRSIMHEQEDNLPVLQSFWYDNEGKTLDKYKYNQMAFVEGEKRFVLRSGKWLYAPVSDGSGKEPVFEFVEPGFNPLAELGLPQERRQYLENQVRDFGLFSDKIMTRIKKH